MPSSSMRHLKMSACNDHRQIFESSLVARSATFVANRMPKCFTETLRTSSTADRERRFWQPSRHPVALQTEEFWRQKLDYLYENPCRKSLVTRAASWRFSSTAYYVSGGAERCNVNISAIGWLGDLRSIGWAGQETSPQPTESSILSGTVVVRARLRESGSGF